MDGVTLKAEAFSSETSAASEKVKKERELRKACAAFEGMFLEMMMKTMRKATNESSVIKKSNGEKIFTDLLDQQYTDLAVKAGNTGLGETLFQYIKSTSPEYGDKGNIFPIDGKNPYELQKLRDKKLYVDNLDIIK